MYIQNIDIKGSDKMAVINIRVNEEVKKEAETIFKSLGLNMSVAMNLFLKKCINENGIPFDLKIPNKETMEAMENHIKMLMSYLKI